MPNIISIKFNEDLVIGGNIQITGNQSIAGSNVPLTFTEIWVGVRAAANEVTTGTPTLNVGERSAINFAQSFNLDYNATNIYNVVRSGSTVTITGPSTSAGGVDFTGANAYRNNTGFPVPADVVFTYNSSSTDYLQIESVTFTQGAVPALYCSNVQVVVKANQDMTKITSPINADLNSDTVSFPYLRGSSAIIKVQNYLGTVATQSIQTPAVLNPNNYTITINNSPYGATLIITYTNQNLLSLKYSLRIGASITIPQTSNIYTNIAPGNYSLVIQDQFGCVKEKAFTVSEYQNNREPYFLLSKSMSFRFADRIDFSLPGNYKTPENTLSCESPVKIPYKEIQQFESRDVITTQFKSNFATNRVFIDVPGEASQEIAVIKKSQNIGVKDKRDAVLYRYGNGLAGVYFLTGNIYDFDTNADIGDYSLNGSLPLWAIVGNYFIMNNAWYQIRDIVYDERVNAEVIIFQFYYLSPPSNVIVGSIFDIFPYEVYEFTIDLMPYNDKNLQIRIVSTDSYFDTKTQLSEQINVKTKQEGTVEIKYSNPENTDVFYSTGITNLLRMLYVKRDAQPDQDSESYKTDTNAILLSSNVYEMDEFEFEPVTEEIMRKLIQAFNHKTLQMDGVYYIINGDVEVDPRLGNTNLYVVRVTLTKSGGAFNSNGSDNLNTNPYVEVPGLIDQGNGSFIEYQS